MQSEPAQKRLQELIEISRRLGQTGELAILGEGNTSAAIDDDRFYVKASGSQLARASAETFVLVSREKTLRLLGKGALTDEEIASGLKEAVCDSSGRKPSVETMLHAYLLGFPEVEFVAHTHPTVVNMILCSARAEELFRGRLFPDEIVCCGPAPVFIPYKDPGLSLAKEIVSACDRYLEKWKTPPRSLLLQNHGLVVTGKTAAQVEKATYMWDKTARILLGATLLGGANYLPETEVRRINTRPDEKERETRIYGGK